MTEVEILPARHFIPSLDGDGLIEVPADRYPDSTVDEDFRKWYEAKNMRKSVATITDHVTVTAPRIIDERTSTSPEGFEIKDTTIVHPPVLDDMGEYGGPVRSIHFGRKNQAMDRGIITVDEALQSIPDAQQITLKELSESLPQTDGPIPAEAIPMRTSSLQYSKRTSLHNQA